MPTGTESSRTLLRNIQAKLGRTNKQKQDSGTAATRLYPSPDSSSVISVGNKGTSLAKHKVLLGVLDLLLLKDPSYLCSCMQRRTYRKPYHPIPKIPMWRAAYC